MHMFSVYLIYFVVMKHVLQLAADFQVPVMCTAMKFCKFHVYWNSFLVFQVGGLKSCILRGRMEKMPLRSVIEMNSKSELAYLISCGLLQCRFTHFFFCLILLDSVFKHRCLEKFFFFECYWLASMASLLCRYYDSPWQYVIVPQCLCRYL